MIEIRSSNQTYAIYLELIRCETIDMHKKLLLFFRAARVYECGDSNLIAIKSMTDIIMLRFVKSISTYS